MGARLVAVVAALTLAVLAAPPRQPAAATQAAPAPAAWNVVMAAGDLVPDADRSQADALAASGIVLDAAPPVFVMLGDGCYDDAASRNGSLGCYLDGAGYAASYGRVFDRTCAVVGNHEYLAGPGAPGFRGYFNQVCRPRADDTDLSPYATAYAFRCAPGSGWWCYVLDSQCRHTEGPGPSCARNAGMLTWFRQHMASHPTRCRLVAWHHPRWGNGAPTTSDPQVDWLWRVVAYGDRVSLVLNGHEHLYARYGSRDQDGRLDPTYRGPRAFTVGTGGVNLIPVAVKPAGVRFRDDRHYGVVQLTLTPQGWASQFNTTTGQVLDRAGANC